MSVEERFEIIRSIGEDCTEEDELRRLLENKPQPICIDGVEPSRRMHFALGVMKAIYMNKLISAGCKVKLVIVDLFVMLKHKMGGDLNKIKVIGEYFIDIWKSVGMHVEGQVEFLLSSDEIKSVSDEYWPLADICQMGMDQREVNVLARKYCDDIKRKNKPIKLSYRKQFSYINMLPGLQEGQEKMSTSDPSAAIYMDDEEANVNLKIMKAFCPPKVVEKNPCLEYIKYLIFPWLHEFTIQRKPENGGEKTFKSFQDLADDYENGEVHPGDLKSALSKAINKILQPVRDHFKNDAKAKEHLKKVKSYPTRILSKFGTEKLNLRENIIKLRTCPNSNMSVEEKFEIIRSIGEECIQEDELRRRLENQPQLLCYDGFEPSGRMHIA